MILIFDAKLAGVRRGDVLVKVLICRIFKVRLEIPFNCLSLGREDSGLKTFYKSQRLEGPF